jgi:DNA-binding NarL/FixJ family response regulator
MLKSEIPEIIILDLRLGDGTGFEILAQLHSKRIQTTVIVFTNFSYPQYRENAMRLGAAYFIDKSDENALFDLLSDLVNSSTDKKA